MMQCVKKVKSIFIRISLEIESRYFSATPEKKPARGSEDFSRRNAWQALAVDMKRSRLSCAFFLVLPSV